MRSAELVAIRRALEKTVLIEDCVLSSPVLTRTDTGGMQTAAPVDTPLKCRFIPRGTPALEEFAGKLGISHQPRFLFFDDAAVQEGDSITHAGRTYKVTSAVARTPVPVKVVGVTEL